MAKVGRKPQYSEWIEEDGLLLIKGWARDGLTDTDIAKNIGVHPATLYEWMKMFPELREALKKGRRPIVVQVEDTFLEKKLSGYFVDEEIVEVTEHPNKTKTTHRKKMKRWIPPDTTAMIFYLKCKKGRLYNDRAALLADNENNNGKLDELIEAVKEV